VGQQYHEQQQTESDAAPQKDGAAKIWLMIVYRHGYPKNMSADGKTVR
jgi:hypothetical protein